MSDDIFDFLKDYKAGEGDNRGTAYFPPDCTRCQWPSFYDITSLLNAGTLGLQTVLEALTDIAIRLTGATRGFLLLLDENNQLEARVARSAEHENLQPEDFKLSNSIVDEALRTRKAQHYSNLISDGGISQTESIVELEIFSAMCMPLMVRGPAVTPQVERRMYFYQPLPNVFGVLYVDSKDLLQQFKAEDLVFFEAMSNVLTTAIVNAKLYQQATTDTLSTLYSRRQFEFLITEGVRRAMETGRPFSLIMVDLDHFKDINDEHGHRLGDDVIRTVGMIMRGNVRALDICCRYGGEEFAVLLADTNLIGAKTAADKLADVFRETEFPGNPKMTASFGVATVPEHADTADGLIAAADQALYRAKADGRDLVRVWSPELTGERRHDQLAGIFAGDFSHAYQNIALLIEFVNVLNSPEGTRDLPDLALRKMIEATGANWGALVIAEGRSFKVEAAYDNRMKVIREPKINDMVIKEVLKAAKSVVVPIETDAGGSTSACAIPLVANEKALGAVYLEAASETGGIQTSLLPFFETLARQVARSHVAVSRKAKRRAAKPKKAAKPKAKPKAKTKPKAKAKPKAKKPTKKKAAKKGKRKAKKK